MSYASDGSIINVDEQVEIGRQDIERRGGCLGEIFRDDAKSAWNPKTVRQEWLRLMERLESGVSEGVWVLDITRFSRKIKEGERLVDAARNGCLVWSHSGEYDLSTAEGRRVFRKEMVDAAAESDKISERVQRGKRRKARRGKDPHGGQRGFGMPGYLPNPPGWEPGDPRTPVDADVLRAEQDLIRECYERLLAGQVGVSPLTWEVNARGFRTVEGNLWTRNSLVRSLVRPALAGIIEVAGDELGARENFDPVVSVENWRRLRAVMDARRTGRPPGRRHILSGLMLCPCGHRLLGTPRAKLPPYPDGSQKREYRCRREAGTSGCGRNHIDARAAEQHVKIATIARLSDPRYSEKIATRIHAVTAERAEIDRELAFLDEQATTLAGYTKTWGAKKVNTAMQPILERVAELEARRSELDEPADPSLLGADIAAEWDAAERDGDLDQLRSMIKIAFPVLTLLPPYRHGDASAARFVWDGAVGRIEVRQHPAEVLYEALAATTAGKTVKELCEATGMSDSWVYARLKMLMTAGEVVESIAARGGDGRNGMLPGRYALNPVRPRSTTGKTPRTRG
ncbi:site-specific DNA recombinase [Frankia sp. AiPs1]